MDGNVPVIRWTTTFEASSVMFLTERNVLISDDGRFFLFNAGLDRDWLLCREGKPPQSLLTSRDLYRGPGPISSLDKIIELDELNGDPIVRLWNSNWDRW